MAQHVLAGHTHGYCHHPQLNRFRGVPCGVNTYLYYVYREAQERGYEFDYRKIGDVDKSLQIKVKTGQLVYERELLERKIEQPRKRLLRLNGWVRCLAVVPKPHQIFRVIPSALDEVEPWEKR